MKKITFLLAGLYLLAQSACIVMDNRFASVAPGTWRVVLELEAKKPFKNEKGEPLPELMDVRMQEVLSSELPFNMEITYVDDENFYIEIINGDERIKLDDIITGHDRKTGNDTMLIKIPEYETYIRADYDAGVIAGNFYNPSKGPKYKIPFIARHGKSHRFTLLKKAPVTDISGKWEATFGLDSEKTWPAIGEFKQNGNHLTGTFMTETGDYRFLEGTIQGNKFYLSTFDGNHAFLFEGKILEDGSITGSFKSGTHYKTTWSAKKNNEVKLRNPEELTFTNKGYEKMTFNFDNPKGDPINLDLPQYKDKVKIIQIFGTWCPNCKDETAFLVDYLKENPNQDLAVIALAFEKHQDKTKANKILQTYIDKMNVPYEMVVAGTPKEAAQALPMLNHIMSYPTMIYLDKNDKIRKIHTGFNGPATSEFANFKTSFDSFVKTLLTE